MGKCSTIVWLLLLVVLVAGCKQQNSSEKSPSAPEESKAAGWVTEIADHLKFENQIESELATRYNMEQPKLFSVVLDEVGEPVLLRDLVQGDALLRAAEYYALTTRDFDVRVGEVIEHGFYPFMDLPDSVSTDMSIIHNGNLVGTFSGKHLNSIGTAKWLIAAKNSVLEDYYVQCYYAHCTGCTSDNKLPDDYLVTIERNPAFWINPETKQPMAESALVGDYRVVDRTGFMSSMVSTAVIEYGSASMKFMCINNEWDSRQLTSKTVSDEPKHCCFIGERSYSVPAGAEAETTFRRYCEGHSPDTGVECTIRWRFQNATYRVKRRLTVANCADRPDWGDAYQLLMLPCPDADGESCNSEIVQHFGQAAEIIPTDCPEVKCSGGVGYVEEPDPAEIIASLQNQTSRYTELGTVLICNCPVEPPPSEA